MARSQDMKEIQDSNLPRSEPKDAQSVKQTRFGPPCMRPLQSVWSVADRPESLAKYLDRNTCMSSLAASRHGSRTNFLVTNAGWQWPAAASRYFWKHTNWVYCTGSPLNMNLSQGRLNIYQDLPFLCRIAMFPLVRFSLAIGIGGYISQLCVSCRTVPPPGGLPPELSTLINALLVLYKQAAAQ